MSEIAVDMDEVLAQHNRELALWHNKTYGTNNHTAETYVTDRWDEVWQIDHALAEQRAVAFHNDRAHSRFQPVAGAYEALRRIKQTHSLSVVTVRRQGVIDDTYKWLAMYFPDLFDNVHFVHFWDAGDSRTKADICKEIGAEYLIDDSSNHCNVAQRVGIQAILFGDYSWNRHDKLQHGVKRVRDWHEVTRMLLPSRQA